MILDYSQIFNAFTDLIIKAVPIALFLYLADIVINLFFSLAFPKHLRKGD